MPTAIVYAPVTGYIVRTTNCNGDHASCDGGLDLTDISGGGDVKLYLNSDVKRIYVEVGETCCSPASLQYYKQSVKVHLYGQGDCYFGWVLYGHLHRQTGDLASGSQTPVWGKRIGQVPTGTEAGCYTNGHSHMEHIGGVLQASCGQNNVVQGSTPIFSWPGCPL